MTHPISSRALSNFFSQNILVHFSTAAECKARKTTMKGVDDEGKLFKTYVLQCKTLKTIRLNNLMSRMHQTPMIPLKVETECSFECVFFFFFFFWGGGGGVAQSVERATPGEEVLGSIPAVAARSLLVGSVSV